MLKEYKLIVSRIIGESSIAQSLCIRCRIGVALRDKAGLHGRNGDAVDSRHVILDGGLGVVDEDAEAHFRYEVVERHDDRPGGICLRSGIYLLICYHIHIHIIVAHLLTIDMGHNTGLTYHICRIIGIVDESLCLERLRRDIEGDLVCCQ